MTEPVTKAPASGEDGSDLKQEKLKITPLVQFIKDKKANKAKEPTPAKNAKSPAKQDSKDAKVGKI